MKQMRSEAEGARRKKEEL
jgi:hypothetical protein